MRRSVSSVLCALLAACAGSPAAERAPPSPVAPPTTTRDWRAPSAPLVPATSLDVPREPAGEISLLPFDYDASPVEAWRYEACVAEHVCPARAVAQPATDGPDAPAVGMTGEHANAFCVARGMRAQSPEQDFAIRQSGGAPLGPPRIDIALGGTHVVSGFRCTRVST